jgi:hypothetical protein
MSPDNSVGASALSRKDTNAMRLYEADLQGGKIVVNARLTFYALDMTDAQAIATGMAYVIDSTMTVSTIEEVD